MRLDLKDGKPLTSNLLPAHPSRGEEEDRCGVVERNSRKAREMCVCRRASSCPPQHPIKKSSSDLEVRSSEMPKLPDDDNVEAA